MLMFDLWSFDTQAQKSADLAAFDGQVGADGMLTGLNCAQFLRDGTWVWGSIILLGDSRDGP